MTNFFTFSNKIFKPVYSILYNTIWQKCVCQLFTKMFCDISMAYYTITFYDILWFVTLDFL